MLYILLANSVLLLRLAFVIFALAGVVAVVRWPKLAWLHLPAVLWAVGIEWSGGVCPLTPLENYLRQAAGQAGYSGSFIEHYLLALLYPTGLTRELQWWLGGIVLLLNLTGYAWLLLRRRRL